MTTEISVMYGSEKVNSGYSQYMPTYPDDVMYDNRPTYPDDVMDDEHAAQRHPYCLSDVTTHWPTILYAETENTEKYLRD